MRAELDVRGQRAPVREPRRINLCGIGDEAGDALDEQLAALDELRWSSIELRTIDGLGVAELDERRFERLVDALRCARLEVAAVASPIAGWSRSVRDSPAADAAELEVLAARCPALGTRRVRVMSYRGDGLDDETWGRLAIDRLGELARRAEAAGLVLVHENCTGWAATSAERMLRLVDAVASPALALLFDTGNGVEYGYDARALLEQVVERVEHVHVKDAVATPAGARYVEPGAGEVDVAGCLARLLRAGYRGAWSLEPHVDLRPHEDGAGAGANRPRRAGFVACGRALERLVAEAVLPLAPGWRCAPGAIVVGPRA